MEGFSPGFSTVTRPLLIFSFSTEKLPPAADVDDCFPPPRLEKFHWPEGAVHQREFRLVDGDAGNLHRAREDQRQQLDPDFQAFSP